MSEEERKTIIDRSTTTTNTDRLTMIEERCPSERKISLCIWHRTDRWLTMNKVFRRKTDIRNCIESSACKDRAERGFSRHCSAFRRNWSGNQRVTTDWPCAEELLLEHSTEFDDVTLDRAKAKFTECRSEGDRKDSHRC